MIEDIAQSIKDKCGITAKVTKTPNGKAVVETNGLGANNEIKYFPSYGCALSWLVYSYNLKEKFALLNSNPAALDKKGGRKNSDDEPDVDFYIYEIIKRIRTFDYVSNEHIEEIGERFASIRNNGISQTKIHYIHKQVLSELLSLSEKTRSPERKRLYALFESKLEQINWKLI